MKKRVIWGLFLILLASLVYADVIEENINSIVHYAELYELGKINYLQLVVYGSTISEGISSKLGQKYVIEGDDMRRGLSEEDAKKLFGEPTEFTNWVWVVNEERDERIDEKMPKWEKRLFDGRKIIITFNAWPHIIKREGEIIKFYEADFDIRFKTHFNFNLDDMLGDVRKEAEEYVETKQNGEELIEKTVDYGNFLWGYLEQNNDDCKNIMNEFFDKEHKRENQKKVRFEVEAYQGDNLNLIIVAEACESCEWPYVNIWFDIRTMGRMKHEDKKTDFKDFRESLKDKSIEELNNELEDTIEDLIADVEESDKDKSFPEIGYYRNIIENINRVLDEKYYENRRVRQENYEKRLDFLTNLLSKYGEVEKEALTEIRYENRLVEEFEEVANKHCRQTEEVCSIDEGCLEGECIEAKGGNEKCRNKIDDDGDGIIDCRDPDCAVECGWICKDVCQDECWQCNDRECRSECQECWKCNKENCDDVCRGGCWECQEEKCRSQPVCKTCVTCEREAWDEYEKEKCNRICDDNEESKECERCQENLKYSKCRKVCEGSCDKCKREECHDKDICKRCHDCWERGGDCEDDCKDCWKCENENCNKKDVCKECQDCNEGVRREVEKERCDKRCDKCEKEKGEKECKECDECRIEEKRHLCDDVCQDECWPCSEEKCGGWCERCWECEKEGKDCESLCQDCWECNEDQCNSKDFCKSCNECQKRIYLEEFPCALPCDMCEDCKKRGDEKEKYCSDSCEECFDCETPDDVKSCIRVCNRLIEEEDKEQRKDCYNLCKENVIFYCNGQPQDTPCLHIYYQCPGKTQKIPCNVFTCTYPDGKVVKQTALCGKEDICGERMVWKDKQCICEGGWYDCDQNASNGCESEKACEGAQERCHNKVDDDFDGLIDCQDLSDCEDKSCDPNSDNVCKDGACVISCPENFILNDDEECIPIEVCMIGYEYDENGNCVKIGGPVVNVTLPEVNITVPEVNVTVENKSVMNETISEPLNVTGGVEGVNDTEEKPEINITEDCLREGETYMPGDTKQCCAGLEGMSLSVGDGTTCSLTAGYVCTAFCSDGNCEGDENACNCPEDCKEEGLGCTRCGDGCLPMKDMMAAMCPEPTKEIKCVEKNGRCIATHLEEIECPDGYYFKEDKCIFIEEEKEICNPWQILNEKGVCEDISEEIEKEEEIIETDKRCAVREDCGDENAICSKGVCKLLPKEVVEEEEVILVETVEVEGVPDEEEIEEKEIGEPEEELKEEEAKEEIEEEDEEEQEEEQHEEETKEENEEKFKEEPEEEPEEEEKEEATPTGNLILGNFLLDIKSEKTTINSLTGWVVKEKECEEDKDCGKNRGCDRFEGRCHCQEYFFDCNGNGEGNDVDGCESEDPTCGGKWEACRHECNENQECIEELGRCECKEGFYECDGDWENGCESEEKCEGCSSDDDCAENRCSEWDNSVVKFACVEDNSYREERAIISFSGGCNIKATGKTESYLNFDIWGRDVEELNQLRHKFEGAGRWCERESEGLKKQREELQESLNDEFLQWFFDDYVANNPSEWEKHISGIFASYWRFVENAKRLHETGKCLEDSDLDIGLIDIEYKSEYGEMHYWEKIEKFEGSDIITPFMEIWVFPTKEFIKEEFKTAMSEGRMPGPDDEEKGPSPKEIEETKKNEKAMERINELSEKYGGSADFLIEVRDEDETLFKVLMSINPEDITKLKVINENNPYNGEVDVNVIVDFDFLYGIIKSFEQDAHLESPPWAGRPMRPVKSIVSKSKIIAKISGAIVSGNIKVKPMSSIPAVLNFLKLIAGGEM